MTRTRRIYNRKNWGGDYHPYMVFCMGNCRSCKDVSLGRRRKLARRNEAQLTIKCEIGEDVNE